MCLDSYMAALLIALRLCPCRLMLKQAEERTLQMEQSAQERVWRMAFKNVEVVRANSRQQEVIRELKRHVCQMLAWHFNQHMCL